jgi:hypothetical protein
MVKIMRNFYVGLVPLLHFIIVTPVLAEDLHKEDVSQDPITDIFDKIESNEDLIELDEDGAADFATSVKDHSEYVDMEVAMVNITDVGFGRSERLEIEVGQSKSFGKNIIFIERCMQQTSPSLSPINSALVMIKNSDTGDSIFNGWIFSSYKSLGQPVVGKYFFTLNHCINKK